MSKAFTKEEGGEGELQFDEPEDEAGEEARPRGPRYITPAGFKRLKDELDRLWTVDRPKVTAEVSAAAAQGDRSENAEYIYGKKKLREIDRRVRFLSKRLETLTVVQPGQEQTDRVFFGAWVTIEDEDGAEATYRIVGPDEFDPKTRQISMDSPMAKALIGKRLGDEVTVNRPKGPTDVTIVKIRYE